MGRSVSSKRKEGRLSRRPIHSIVSALVRYSTNKNNSGKQLKHSIQEIVTVTDEKTDGSTYPDLDFLGQERGEYFRLRVVELGGGLLSDSRRPGLLDLNMLSITINRTLTLIGTVGNRKNRIVLYSMFIRTDAGG